MRQLANVRNNATGLGYDHDRPAPSGICSQPHDLEGIPGEQGVAMPRAAGYDQDMHRVDPTDFEFGRHRHPVGYRKQHEDEGPASFTCGCCRSWVVIELGWIHAGLVILAVIGGSMGSLQILGLIDTSTSGDLEKIFPLAHLVNSLQLACLLVPAPVTIGIIIRRRRLFFEPPDPDRGMSLPAMVAVAVIGLWWLMPASGIGSHYLDPWIWW